MTPFTLVTCSYNTPIVLQRCLRSFHNTHAGGNHRVLVMENSTNDDTTSFLQQNNIKHVSNPGMSHGNAVNIAIDRCETPYMLLIDSDVIFKRDTRDVLSQAMQLDVTLAGRIEGDRGGKRIHKRVHPWFCLINVDHLKKHKILFNDEQKIKENGKHDKIYDVGSSMFKQVRSLGLKIAHMNIEGDYFDHWEGLSWYTNKYDAEHGDTNIDLGGTHDNTTLYEHGKQKNKVFLDRTKHLDDIDLTGAFV